MAQQMMYAWPFTLVGWFVGYLAHWMHGCSVGILVGCAEYWIEINRVSLLFALLPLHDYISPFDKDV